MVAPSENLLHAVTRSLAAWNVVVEAVPDDNPGPTMPASSSEGRRIAARYDALAVVWVSESNDGFALWVFDSRTDQVLARPLPSGPPFDEPMAAQVALTVKTLLRTIPELIPDELSPEHAPVDRTVDRTVDETTVTPRTMSESTPEPMQEQVGVDVLMAAGLRGLALTPGVPDARMLLGVTLWPRGLGRALGLSLLIESGPGVQSPHSELDARWTDSSLIVGVRGRLHLGARLDIGGNLGLGARLTTLHGETRAGSPVAERRVTLVSRAEIELGVRLAPWLRLELRVGTLLGWSVQRYFAGNELALDVNRASVQGLLGLEFRIR